MKAKFTRQIAATALAVGVGISAHAVTYFSDDFESGLGQWHAGSAYLVGSPGHGQVMTFAAATMGGDAWTLPFVVPSVGPGVHLYLSFDYKGIGGFLGILPGSNNWLAGETGNAPLGLIYGENWNHYELEIPTGVTGPLMLEDWKHTAHGDQLTPHGAYFDNFIVSDQRGARVPEGGFTLALLGLSLGAMGWVCRKLQ